MIFWEDSVTRSQPGGVCHNLLHNKLTTLIYNQQLITALYYITHNVTSLVIERVGGSLERIGSFLLKRIGRRSCWSRSRSLGLHLIIEIDCLISSRLLALLSHHLHLVLDPLVSFLVAPIVNLLVSEPGSLSSVTLLKQLLKGDRK